MLCCEIFLSNFLSYTSYIVAKDTKTPPKEINNAPIDINAEGAGHQCHYFCYVNVNISNFLCVKYVCLILFPILHT